MSCVKKAVFAFWMISSCVAAQNQNWDFETDEESELAVKTGNASKAGHTDSPVYVKPTTDHEIKVGGNYTYMKLTPNGLSSFYGNLAGVQASFENKAKDKAYGAVTFLWREGTLNGTASLQRNIFNVDTQVRAGYTAGSEQDSLFTFFTGFGWQYIAQKLTGGGTPLNLNYNEVYIPVGLLTQSTQGQFSMGLNGIWMPQVFPTVNIIPLGNARWVTEYTLANFTIELPLLYRCDRDSWKVLVEVKPFFEYWQDGKTLAKSSVGTPLGLVRNTYYIGGCELNVGAEF